jgi:nicotinamide mononucleotide (NMN) deamidase PncC
MLKQRREIAEQVAAALFEAERAIDAALSKTAGLTGLMPGLREQAGISALIGQEAVERASEAIAALAQARRSIVETHKELSVAQHQMGLGAVAVGDDMAKPTGLAPARPQLRRAS